MPVKIGKVIQFKNESVRLFSMAKHKIKAGMKPPHPGGFVKRSALPEGLSIKAAAEAAGHCRIY